MCMVYCSTSRSSLIRQLESLSDLFDGDQDPWRPHKRVWCSKQAGWRSAEETGRRAYYSKMFVCLQLARIYLACLSQVLNARDCSACCCHDAQQAAVSVESRLTSSFLWLILQDQLTWAAWLKISFVLTASARMSLDCRLVGSNAKLLTLAMCQWHYYSMNVWHGECDQPDNGKRGILLWRMIVYWCYRFSSIVIDQLLACVQL